MRGGWHGRSCHDVSRPGSLLGLRAFLGFNAGGEDPGRVLVIVLVSVPVFIANSSSEGSRIYWQSKGI